MFSIDRETINDVELIRINGRVDMQAMTVLQKEIDILIVENIDKLIVDCRNMDYISSTGIRIFLILYRFFASKEKHMIICGLNSVVDNIFDMAGLKQIFQIEDDCKNAVKKLL
jgi:anti-sigma B factor antagonist